MPGLRRVNAPFIFALLGLIAVLPAPAADWVHWRGPEQNGVSREKDLPDKWSPDPAAPDNNLIWKQPYGCRSTPLLMNGRVYFLSTVGEGATEQERVVCLERETGKLLWEHRFNVFLTSIVSNRLGWTNLAGDPETGNVYAHGTQGLLYCFNKDGKILWSHSLTEEYGRVSGYGGRLCSPIVDGDLVVIGMLNASWGNLARGGSRFVAFDKRTGQVVWWNDPGTQAIGTYYSVPVVANINGQRLLICGGGDGYVHAIKVRTGENVWKYHYTAGVVNSSPIVDGNRIYICHGEENLQSADRGKVICFDGAAIKDGTPKVIWENNDAVMAGYTSPLLADGKLYVCDDTARMFCFDAQSGKSLWRKPYKYGRLSRGSPVMADGKIYVFEVNAKFHILKPTAKGCDELHEQFFPGFVETNGTPAVADGRLYFATLSELFCIGKKDHKMPADKVPEAPKETPFDAKADPVLLQVVPADVVLAPGEKAAFTVRGLDANGRVVKEYKQGEWTLPVPPPPPKSKVAPAALRGTISADGQLVVAKDVPNQQGYAEVSAGGLKARARVRVVPPLPIKVDFSQIPEGHTPDGWVNCMNTKFAVVKQADGTKVLKKLADNAIPPFARANAFMGLPSMTDYTIQADLKGKEVRGYLPDMGIGANRYTLLLDGKLDDNEKEGDIVPPKKDDPKPAKDDNKDKKRFLRLISWEGPRRVYESSQFHWQPDVWYTFKLTVDVQKDKAVVRGKVWPAGEKEPEKWTIVFEDKTPNREGAPALYGYATGILADQIGTEIFYNNVSVTPNKK